MKSPLKSKTIIANALMIAIAVVSVLMGSDVIPVKPEVWALSISVLNIFLRFATNSGVAFKKQASDQS